MAAHHEHSNVPYTGVHHLVRRFLEPMADVLVVLLAIALFGVMLRGLYALAAHIFAPGLTFRTVIAEALFILVVMELQRLLIIYLRDHHVSVDLMLEVTIVAALREVCILGATEMEPLRLFSLTVFVLVLGLLLRFGDLRAGRRGARNARGRRARAWGRALVQGSGEDHPPPSRER
jgi:uncharacterized membrane protein (DUF373 family)